MPSLSAERLRGIALTILITAGFAAFWGWNGSATLPGPARLVTTLLVLVITVIWFGLAHSFYQTARQLPSMPSPTTNPFRTHAYWVAVLAQFIAIPIASRLLSFTGHPDAIMPAIAIIVGLHFFGLIPAFRSWLFAGVGAAMVLLASISLTLPPSVALESSGEQLALRAAVVGLGSALILWGSILPIVAATYWQLVHKADKPTAKGSLSDTEQAQGRTS
jgi:hypothetical protein